MGLPGVSRTWSPDKVIKLFSMLSDDSGQLTQADIAAKLGVDRSTVTRKVNTVDWDEFAGKLASLCNMSHDDFVDSAAVSHRINVLAKVAMTRQRKEIDSRARSNHISSQIIQNFKPTPLPPMRFSVRPPKDRDEEHFVLLLSDLHVGQKFEKSETGGLNAYNIDTFLKRAENLRRAVHDIYKIHTNSYAVPVLHVFALGDMVQGTNQGGEWGGAYTEIDIHQQAIQSARTVSDLLSSFSAIFDKVTFSGVVGNHGRAGITMSSDKISANWDNMVYELIRANMALHKNVEVDITPSWWRQFNVNGTEIAIVHGDRIKGGCSITGLRNLEGKLQEMFSQSTGRKFDVLCMGHWHNFMKMQTMCGGIIINGSFVGGDIYSMTALQTSNEPLQVLFGIHEKRKITHTYDLKLETPRSHVLPVEASMELQRV